MKTFAGAIASLMLTTAVSADDKVPPKPDEATVKAWTSRGVTFTWFHISDNGHTHFENQSPLYGYKTLAPAFAYTSNDATKLDLANLPAPKVPFAVRFWNVKTGLAAAMKGLTGVKNLTGLSINECVLSAKEWQAVGDFKDLTVLDLSGGYNNVTRPPEAVLKGLKDVKGLERLTIHSMTLSDAGVKDLAELKSLKHLTATNTGLTDARLKNLTGLTNLEELDLAFTPVSDAGVATLKEFKNLTVLGLSSTPITDACVKDLASLSKLQTLRAFNTKLTKEGRETLKKSLPNCTIAER